MYDTCEIHFSDNYGNGRQHYHIVIDANSFADVTLKMMNESPEEAIAAFAAALSSKYPAKA